MASNFNFKGADGSYYDISVIFDTSASALTDANNRPFKTNSSTTNILNTFGIYSSSGGGHPLQSRLINYSIKSPRIDLTKYYMPKYYLVNSGTSVTIPTWPSQIGLVIQSKGGSNGTNSTYYTNNEPRTVVWCNPDVSGNTWKGTTITYKVAQTTVTKTTYTGIPPQNYNKDRRYLTTAPTAPVVSGKTLILTTSTNTENADFTASVMTQGRGATTVTVSGKVTITTVTYTYANGPYTATGGTGAGGNCYCGVYSIPTTNRPSTMTYKHNESGVSKVTFNDTTNSSTYSAVTVYNGANGGNATVSPIVGNGAAGTNNNVVGIINESKFSGTSIVTSDRGSYKGTSSGSPFLSNETAIKAAMGISSNFSFVSTTTSRNYGSEGHDGVFIYFFLL